MYSSSFHLWTAYFYMTEKNEVATSNWRAPQCKFANCHVCRLYCDKLWCSIRAKCTKLDYLKLRIIHDLKAVWYAPTMINLQEWIICG